jgi:uncharacterized protein YjbJ (UPF0337 family)
MDKDRIAGAAKQAKGAVREAVGKAVGDSKLAAEGKSDKIEGKVQNAIGGLKDALKGSGANRLADKADRYGRPTLSAL